MNRFINLSFTLGVAALTAMGGEPDGTVLSNPRIIIGTGDQVAGETPEENLHAMIDEAKRKDQ